MIDMKRIRISEEQTTEIVIVDVTKEEEEEADAKIVTTSKKVVGTMKQTIVDVDANEEEEEDELEDGEVEDNEYVVDDDEDDYNIPEEDDQETDEGGAVAYQEGDGDCRAFYEAKLIQEDGESYTEDDFDGFSYVASLADNDDLQRNVHSVGNSTANSTDDEDDYLEFEQIVMSRNNSTFNKNC
jgi:hypothetical protein